MANKTIDAEARQAMRSPVNWAVLSLLIERPGYGYELRQRLEREYEDVLSPSESHIYKALDELESRGFIERVPGSRRAARAGADRGQPKVSYQATVEGVRGFQERLFGQMREDRRQSWMFLRQLAVFAYEPDAGLRIIERLEQEYADEARAAPVAPPDGSHMDVVSALVARLAAEESRLAMEGKLPWIRYARREFEALARDRARREASS